MRGRARRAVWMLGAMSLAASLVQAAGEPCRGWPGWQRFAQLYLSPDGRVIDAGTPERITVSEGQAYGLTFALIANDPASFERILSWTGDNLAGGNLARSLPAWKWGHGDDGRWHVLDPNSAADADLWIAYILIEAARLWRNPAYSRLAESICELILREEVAAIPGLGMALLPAPKGFVTQRTWRLNASYTPVQLLRALYSHSGDRRWAEVLNTSLRVINASAPHGYAADWIEYRESGGFAPDSSTHGVGSYDAIRVYLWAGMLADRDSEGAALVHRLAPMAATASRRVPPESIDTQTLEMHREAPPGFLAALLPLLSRLEYTSVVDSFRTRVAAESLTSDQHYYGDALALFGLGWMENRYGFDRQGHLRVAWNRPCPSK